MRTAGGFGFGFGCSDFRHSDSCGRLRLAGQVKANDNSANCKTALLVCVGYADFV